MNRQRKRWKRRWQRIERRQAKRAAEILCRTSSLPTQQFFVDRINGNDEFAGTDPQHPLKTLAEFNRRARAITTNTTLTIMSRLTK